MKKGTKVIDDKGKEFKDITNKILAFSKKGDNNLLKERMRTLFKTKILDLTVVKKSILPVILRDILTLLES